MTAAYEELLRLLDERDVGYSTSDDQAVRTDLRGEVATYRIVARVESEVDLFQVVGYSPMRVPEGCRPAIAEAVARANYGLRLGKFELDMDDGELRFQMAQVLTGESVGEEIIARMISTAINMLDMYLPAFLSVIYANELPKDAIQRAEAGFRRPSDPEGDDQESFGETEDEA
jgi:hypothetical protein